MWAWAFKNKEWLFSGIGVVFIGWVGQLIFNKSSDSSTQTIRSGDGSINIQGGRDVTVGTKNMKNDVEQR
ncbi:MAG: hypothetical protein CVU19_05245 [Betaproteobacteria bacterium HGW-Betaproteobacteria-13]|nr:MAG: hypothetical protein CVU19_05245 [Betaproteobacteria bacterium HGW-Betaproteobacteria-13]